jgi:predicted secreted protein
MFKIIGADGKQYGPVSVEQIRQWLAEGRAKPETLAQAEGSADWKPLGKFPEFATTAPAGVVPPPVPPPTTGYQPRPAVPTYLVPAILSTLFCCMPFGIIAIVFAAQVSSKLNAGDVPGAQKASANARTWLWVTVLTGLIIPILWFVVVLSHPAMRFHRW